MVQRARAPHDIYTIRRAKPFPHPARTPVGAALASSVPRMTETNMRNLPGAMT